MKKLLPILVLVFFLISCSSNDDNIAPTSITFLENYEGTTWEVDNNDDLYDFYLRIINNLNTPFEEWDINEGDDCYEYYLANLSDIGYEITENSEDEFQIKYLLSEEDMIDLTITLTVIDNSLNFKGERLENGIITHSFTNIYLSTSIDVDSFTLCD